MPSATYDVFLVLPGSLAAVGSSMSVLTPDHSVSVTQNSDAPWSDNTMLVDRKYKTVMGWTPRAACSTPSAFSSTILGA